MLHFIPLHFLCTHFWQLVHCNELLPKPLLQTPDGYLTAFCLTFCRSPLIITLVLFILTLMPLLSTLSFHSLSLLINSCSVSAITAKQWCSGKYLFGEMHSERGARAYNGGPGAEPPAGSRVRAPGGGQGGKAPLKLKRFYILDMQWKQQTCLTTLCILETE